MKLFLNNLRLHGDNRSYEVKFHAGLNFISGPISTGKSTILEMIDYCLGKKKHKTYEEVRLTCKFASLDLNLNGKRYLIERPLFSFELPVKVFKWVETENGFSSDFEYFIVKSPKEDNSLAAFLARTLEMPDVRLSGQTFSFRDLFKYCYIKQTDIDSENILNEKNYSIAFKRKPTFEIILNCLNELLNELKNSKREQENIIQTLLERKEAIVSFLREVELLASKPESDERKVKLIIDRQDLFNELKELKVKGKLKSKDTETLEQTLFQLRRKIQEGSNEEQELNKYLEKLKILQNQYSNEIIKIDYLLLSNGKLKAVEFDTCPSCNMELELAETDTCKLCGQSLIEFDDEEEKAIKLERKRLQTRLNSLIDFIETQQSQLGEVIRSKNNRIQQSYKVEQKIDSIQRDFISPYIEKIEILNRGIGEFDKQIENLNLYDNVQLELATIANNIQKEENKLTKIVESIGEQDAQDFENVILQLSKDFYSILHEFKFPKLSDAYIDLKSYLPYVRNTKYDDIGSLGAVTLINVAYFLSILKFSLKLKNSYHPKILILDTISKNLGTRESNPDDDDEFKDSKIFKSVLKYLVDFGIEHVQDIQLIIVNNDYTDALEDSSFIARFDGLGTGDLKYGLIDDIT
ncbi:MAG: AAA family ATPase [Cyclobacteriaceae bacterium]